eukprot:1209504-Alexandrium_andersonii.AAC.1
MSLTRQGAHARSARRAPTETSTTSPRTPGARAQRCRFYALPRPMRGWSTRTWRLRQSVHRGPRSASTAGGPPRGGSLPLGRLALQIPVSYTHLTLPTICSV